jgi:LmbE family N-acetylglucosaminyl deacetylase
LAATARLAESGEGAQVTMAVVSVPNRAEERTREAHAGAKKIGARLFIVYEEKQCRVEDIPMHELVRRFDQLVGDVRPDLVITHSAHDSTGITAWSTGPRCRRCAARRATCSPTSPAPR